MGVSAENKMLAQYLRTVFGGSPSVTKYWDDAHKSSVDILSVSNVPCKGIIAYTTVGLSDYSIELRLGTVPLGVEFVMAAPAECEWAPNALATCAFEVINSKRPCRPGSVLPGVMEVYSTQCIMKHVLMVPPFLWTLHTQTFANNAVAWLLAVPISDEEYRFARERGSSELEELFEKQQVDIFNWDRDSVV